MMLRALGLSCNFFSSNPWLTQLALPLPEKGNARIFFRRQREDEKINLDSTHFRIIQNVCVALSNKRTAVLFEAGAWGECYYIYGAFMGERE